MAKAGLVGPTRLSNVSTEQKEPLDKDNVFALNGAAERRMPAKTDPGVDVNGWILKQSVDRCLVLGPDRKLKSSTVCVFGIDVDTFQ